CCGTASRPYHNSTTEVLRGGWRHALRIRVQNVPPSRFLYLPCWCGTFCHPLSLTDSEPGFIISQRKRWDRLQDVVYWENAMNYLHYEFDLSANDAVEVTLDRQANVRLL